MNDNFKSGFVTIIGRPNVGKSTLINALVGEKLTITSSKAQTTRNKIQCILTTETSQIILVDTPGIVAKANTKLGKYMGKAASTAYEGVDIVVFVVTPDKTIGTMDREIIKTLRGNKVFLVINKIDTISKNELLEVMDVYSKAYNFAEIVPLSAIRGETYNLATLLVKYLDEGPMFFPDNMITDQPERQIAAEMIREKLLHNLDQEVPHGIGVEILQMKERKGKEIVDIDAIIYCERESHKGMIIGKGGDLIKKIGKHAREDIERMVGMKVFLQTRVKVKKDWRNNDMVLKDLGYTE